MFCVFCSSTSLGKWSEAMVVCVLRSFLTGNHLEQLYLLYLPIDIYPSLETYKETLQQ